MRTILGFLARCCIITSLILYSVVALNYHEIMVAVRLYQIAPNLPKFGTPTDKDAKIYPIVQLWRNGRGFCTGFVADANYIITAAHCIDDNYGLDLAPISIHDQHGKDTGVVAQAVAMSNRIDVGMIKGDFRKFKSMRADFYGFTPTNKPGKYQTCGFPGLQNRLTCTDFSPMYNDGFYIAGKGFLIPGMSGGPVYDTQNNVVIGVNSAAGQGVVLVSPLLGMLGMFGVEK